MPRAPDQDQDELVGQLMTTTARMSSDITELRLFQENLDGKLDQVSGQSRDLAVVKRIAAWVLGLLIPAIAAFVFDSIREAERFEYLQKQVGEHVGDGHRSGHPQAQREVGQVETKVEILETRQADVRRSLEGIQETLDDIRREGVPRRARGRRP